MAKTLTLPDDFPLDGSRAIIVGAAALATINTTYGPTAVHLNGEDSVVWVDIHDWSVLPSKPALTHAQLAALGFAAVTYGGFYT